MNGRITDRTTEKIVQDRRLDFPYTRRPRGTKGRNIDTGDCLPENKGLIQPVW